MMSCQRLNSFAVFFAKRFSLVSFLLILLLLFSKISCITAAAAGLQSSTGISQSTPQRVPLSSPAASHVDPKTQGFGGNDSLSREEKMVKSFENSAASSKGETSEGEKTGQMSKVTRPEEEKGNTDNVVDRNETLSVESKNLTTAHSTPTQQLYSTNGSSDEVKAKVKAKVKVKSDGSKQTTESATCCGALTSDPPTTEAAAAMDVYNYNEYDNDNNNNDDDGDGDDGIDRGEMEADDNNYERNVYGNNDSSDGKQTLGDYREEDAEEDSAETSKAEYLYASENVTSNETEISSNQDQDLNSDPSYYYSQGAASAGDADWRASGPSADRVDYGGHSFGGGGSPPEYEAGSRDYHFGTKHRSFDMYLGQKISEMRSGSYHGRQSLSLRWLEHRQINHFAIFLWLVAALAIVGIVITAYRFRHSVYNAIQNTRTNYKQGRRIGIEEANDLLSHAQV